MQAESLPMTTLGMLNVKTGKAKHFLQTLDTGQDTEEEVLIIAIIF